MSAGEMGKKKWGMVYWNIDFLEHIHALYGIDQRNVLRGGHDHRAFAQPSAQPSPPLGPPAERRLTIDNNLLHNAQLNITGARRQIEDEHIQLAPLDLMKQLLQRLHDHQAAPDDRLLLADQISDAHALDAIVLHGDKSSLVGQPGLARFRQVQQSRDRRPEDVRVEQPGPAPLPRERQTEVDGERGFSYAALGAGHGDDLGDPREAPGLGRCVLRPREEFGARRGVREAERVFVVGDGGGGEAPERGEVGRPHFSGAGGGTDSGGVVAG